MTVDRLRGGRSSRRLIAGIAFAGCVLFLTIQAEVAPAEQRRVLAVLATRRDGPGAIVVDQTLQRILAHRLQGNLDYYSEYVDEARFPDPDFQHALRAFLKRKYGDRRFDVVIVNWDAALALVLASRGDGLFDRVPIVFNVLNATPNVSPGPRSTGVTRTVNLARTLTMVTELQPETKRVFVVSGSSAQDKNAEALARAQLRAFEGRFEFTYWSGLPMPVLLERVANLPPDSIVYPLTITEDHSGARFQTLEPIDRIVAAANAPVYAWATPEIGRGAVGGSMYSPERLATRLAELALRVLGGERPEDIPVAEVDVNVEEVDWRQLRRWGISKARVRAGTTIRFQDPSLWDRYRSYIIGTGILVLSQTALIAGLLVQRVRRRRLERALRESEERLQVMADTAPVLVWRSDTDKARDFFNQPWLEFRGRTMEQELGDGWTEGVHSADLNRCLATYTQAFDERRPFRMEYRLRRADGEYRWVLDSGVPRVASESAFAGYIGSCIDITERKLAEAELRESEAALRTSIEQNRDLAGRLITAQEAERARIARELHDDVGQRVASFSIAVGTIRRRLAGAPQPLHDDLASLQRETVTLSKDLRLLSHELHPPLLEHLGLADALRTRCEDVRAESGVTVALDVASELGPVPDEVALCLYRVAQEALRNVVNHADARTATVALSRQNGRLAMRITDDGRGFDPGTVTGRRGLGLVSLDERVRMLAGTLAIESSPQSGTTVSVTLPVGDEDATTTSAPRG